MKRMTALKSSVIVLFLLISLNGFSQTKVESGVATESYVANGYTPELNDSEKLDQLKEQLEGTYELQVSIPDYQPLYTLEMMELIQASRLSSATNTITWDQYTTIVIFPKGLDVQPSHN